MPKVLSEDAIRRFREDGHHHPVRVLDDDQVRRFRTALEGFEARHPTETRKLKTKAHLLCPWVDEMIRIPRLLDVFEDLIGPDILCWSAAFRVKEADGATFAGWHQDTVYSPVRPNLTFAALALSECGARQGCLSVIPGSHRGEILPHAESSDPTSILARGQYITSDIDTTQAIDLEIKAGEIALFDHGIIHGSRPNLGPDRRIMILIEMMPTSAYLVRGQESATLVRGRDAYGHFAGERRPTAEFGPEEIAAWHAAVGMRAKNIFADSKLPVSEAYGGGKATAA
ncbi:MAG: phytanoyl-CoA dioxygenase family protein [Alphaproteobacteria bacterium]|nr:phytanoyl-CoA dioxygenase family protein [Alphaproteobacteria bacterium]